MILERITDAEPWIVVNKQLMRILAASAIGIGFGGCATSEPVITIPKTAEQLGRIDTYSVGFLLPAVHRADVGKVHCDDAQGTQITLEPSGSTLVECTDYSEPEKVIVK